MHNHLALLRTIQRDPKLIGEENPCSSDMDIILTQALLMDAGSTTFKAINSGEIANILAGLVNLAYTALQALAVQKKDLIENAGEGYQEYQMLGIMRLLSKKIHDCSSGEAERYAELYHLCANLASGFLNADFDKAFQVYHEWRKANQNASSYEGKTLKASVITLPDLTDCLYE